MRGQPLELVHGEEVEGLQRIAHCGLRCCEPLDVVRLLGVEGQLDVDLRVRRDCPPPRLHHKYGLRLELGPKGSDVIGLLLLVQVGRNLLDGAHVGGELDRVGAVVHQEAPHRHGVPKVLCSQLQRGGQGLPPGRQQLDLVIHHARRDLELRPERGLFFPVLLLALLRGLTARLVLFRPPGVLHLHLRGEDSEGLRGVPDPELGAPANLELAFLRLDVELVREILERETQGSLAVVVEDNLPGDGGIPDDGAEVDPWAAPDHELGHGPVSPEGDGEGLGLRHHVKLVIIVPAARVGLEGDLQGRLQPGGELKARLIPVELED